MSAQSDLSSKVTIATLKAKKLAARENYSLNGL